MKPLRPLLEHRLVIVTGKGGTGKTSVAAALALAAAAAGRRVLVAETGRDEHVPRLIAPGGPRAGYAGRELRPGLRVMRVDPYEALTEYLQLQLRVPGLVSRAMKNKGFRQLMDAAPGWRELITLGKVWQLGEQRDDSGRPTADLLIIDAPATGHGLTFLDVPGAELIAAEAHRRRKEGSDLYLYVTRKRVLAVIPDQTVATGMPGGVDRPQEPMLDALEGAQAPPADNKRVERRARALEKPAAKRPRPVAGKKKEAKKDAKPRKRPRRRGPALGRGFRGGGKLVDNRLARNIDGDADWELHSEIITITTEGGVSPRYAIVVQYWLVDPHSGEEIWRKGINTRHQVQWNEAFAGATRIIRAVEGATKKNLSQLVTALARAGL